MNIKTAVSSRIARIDRPKAKKRTLVGMSSILIGGAVVAALDYFGIQLPPEIRETIAPLISVILQSL